MLHQQKITSKQDLAETVIGQEDNLTLPAFMLDNTPLEVVLREFSLSQIHPKSTHCLRTCFLVEQRYLHLLWQLAVEEQEELCLRSSDTSVIRNIFVTVGRIIELMIT